MGFYRNDRMVQSNNIDLKIKIADLQKEIKDLKIDKRQTFNDGINKCIQKMEWLVKHHERYGSSEDAEILVGAVKQLRLLKL
jgi:hypothetical protein